MATVVLIAVMIYLPFLLPLTTRCFKSLYRRQVQKKVQEEWSNLWR